MICSNIMFKYKVFINERLYIFEKYQVKRAAVCKRYVTIYVQFSDVPSRCYVNSSQFESVYTVFESRLEFGSDFKTNILAKKSHPAFQIVVQGTGRCVDCMTIVSNLNPGLVSYSSLRVQSRNRV